MSIALYVLKREVPYKYTVFSPRSAVADDPFEFLHDAPNFTTGYANRTLKIPRQLQVSEGMFATPFRFSYLNVYLHGVYMYLHFVLVTISVSSLI